MGKRTFGHSAFFRKKKWLRRGNAEKFWNGIRIGILLLTGRLTILECWDLQCGSTAFPEFFCGTLSADGEKKGNIRYVPRWVYSDGRSIWGCGLLIDPSDDFTQIESSLRMETLRDALEDYEYIQLLKDAADRTGDAATIAKVNTLIKDTIDSIVFDYKAYETEERWDRIQWEADWKKMRDARDRLGEAIEQLKQQE